MNKKNIRHYPTRTKVSGEGNPPVNNEKVLLLIEWRIPIALLRKSGDDVRE